MCTKISVCTCTQFVSFISQSPGRWDIIQYTQTIIILGRCLETKQVSFPIIVKNFTNPKEARSVLQSDAAQEHSWKWNHAVEYGAYRPYRSIYSQSQTESTRGDNQRSLFETHLYDLHQSLNRLVLNCRSPLLRLQISPNMQHKFNQ